MKLLQETNVSASAIMNVKHYLSELIAVLIKWKILILVNLFIPLVSVLSMFFMKIDYNRQIYNWGAQNGWITIIQTLKQFVFTGMLLYNFRFVQQKRFPPPVLICRRKLTRIGLKLYQKFFFKKIYIRFIVKLFRRSWEEICW